MTDCSGSRLPWRQTGVWLSGDCHAHYRLVGFDKLVQRSAEHCDFQAITSHPHEEAAFKAQPKLIAAAHDRYPDLVLINGVQWNPPVGNFVTVWMPGAAEGMPQLEGFLGRFDVQVGGAEKTEEMFLDGLRSLSRLRVGDHIPAAFIQHPHPGRQFGPEQIRRGLDAGPALAGICVSSGKREKTPGQGVLHPWATEVGGFADTLFAEGRRVVLTTDSDLHQPGVQGVERDWPGVYRRTCLFCPERSEAGVFEGLRGGAWYLVVGGLIDDLNFTARDDDEWVMPGEELSLPKGATFDVTVALTESGTLEALELIGNPGGSTRVLARARGNDLPREGDVCRWTVRLEATDGFFFLGVRGHGLAKVPQGDAAHFYSAPLWVRPT